MVLLRRRLACCTWNKEIGRSIDFDQPSNGAVFGELWKLEPLPEERKSKWRREMEWLLAPTNYMVELVPAKQYGSNGRTLEIMRPKARGDVHMNLPALRKLDSMLLETLDAMTNMEFWYEDAEGKNRGIKESKTWWLPTPQVPIGGLSDGERKKLLNLAKLVHQIFKAAKAINETILLEMPIPNIISEALPKVRGRRTRLILFARAERT